MIRSLVGGEHNGDDETVETESFTENEDQDHTDVDVLLGVGTHTSVTDDADGETSGKGGETTAETGSEVLVASVHRVLVVTVLVVIVGRDDNVALEDDSHDKTVDTEDTRHNDWDEGLEDEVGLQHTDGANTDTGLGGSVSGAQVAENESSGHAHEAEEGVLVGVVDKVSHCYV